MKISPGLTLSDTFTRKVPLPSSLYTSAMSPPFSPSLVASCGCSSRYGSGTVSIFSAIRRSWYAVCQMVWLRPVVAQKGYAARRSPSRYFCTCSG